MRSAIAAVAAALACAAVGAAQEPQQYEIGGPLAGVKLPLFPTQHGEPPGHPGHSDGFPEYELYPGSVEHFRTVGQKNLPTRPLWDRQSQIKNFLAAELPDVERARIEPYAAPVYKVNRYGPASRTDLTLKPVPVVRLAVGAPALRMDLGELPPGLYAVRVIGAVETQKVRNFRAPLYISMQINDGLRGETSHYRRRAGYCDEFYSVVEFYFHAPEKRPYQAEVKVDDGSAVDLLVHNISLDDVLAGSDRRAIKTRQTLVTEEALALIRAGLSPEQRRGLDSIPALTPEERLARDAAIWNWLPPLNAQGAALLNNVPEGAPGKTAEQLREEFGQWEVVENVDHSLGMVLSYDKPRQNALLINRKLNLTYTMDDLRARRPLPDPYPYKDDGAGLFFPDPADPDKGTMLAPIARAVQDRFRRSYYGYGGVGGNYARTIALSQHPDLLRDAAVSLIRYAYQFPTIDSADYLAELAVGVGFQGYDMRCRQRHDKAYWMTDYSAYLVPLRDYDVLFPYIQGNEELAASVRRFVPWVRTSQDLIMLLDVYLVQHSAKRTMRYLDMTHPTGLADIAAAMGDARVTDPWMEWLFSKTFVYPMPPAGLQDVMISGHDREGAQYIASTFYARGEGASRLAASLDRYLAAGGNPRYDLSDASLYPKPQAHCRWLLRILVAGGDALRIGDVSGPSMSHGQALRTPEEGIRLGWKWSGDPRFAWLIKHVYGRGGMSDAEWRRVEEAAAQVPRAPWLDNRSRAVENWAGVLETGLEHDDFRFRRAVAVRTGSGVGHQHSDALDLQVFAHGMAAVMDGGQRGGYSEPNDRRTRVHNVVEVDGRDHLAYGWVRALSDASGARYMRTEALPPEGCNLFGRQTALIDVDEGRGSQRLSAELQRPGSRLPTDVTLPNSYVFDVFRVAGGRLHTYCAHATVNDGFEWNAMNVAAVEHLEQESGETDTEAKYLSPFQLSKDTKFAGDAPDVLVATWRQLRFEKDTKGGVSEERVLGLNFDPDAPRRFTRWHLFGTAGLRALRADVVMHQTGYQWTTMMVRNLSGDGQLLERAYPAIIEPYMGEPFIAQARELSVADNETDALRAVALAVRTTNGHDDLCFADGRPGQVRTLAGTRIAGEFAYLSRDAQGLRAAALTGGTLLEAPGVRIVPARSEWTGTITKVDYPNRTIWIDQPWPACGGERLIEILPPGCRSSVAAARIVPEGQGSRIVLTHGADFYRAPVGQVLPDERRVDGRLPLPAGRGDIRGMTASNDTMTRFWRIAGHRNSDFTLDGPVAEAEFGPSNALRIWEYGIGDRVRRGTFVSIRRVAENEFEADADVDARITLGGRVFDVTAAERTAAGAPVRLTVR